MSELPEFRITFQHHYYFYYYFLTEVRGYAKEKLRLVFNITCFVNETHLVVFLKQKSVLIIRIFEIAQFYCIIYFRNHIKVLLRKSL